MDWLGLGGHRWTRYDRYVATSKSLLSANNLKFTGMVRGANIAICLAS